MNIAKSRNIFFCHPSLFLQTFVLSLVTVFTWITLAGEGFSHDPSLLPLNIQRTWDSVFMLAPATTGGLGSAVLVSKRQISDDSYELTFLTSGHIVEKSCGIQIGYCDNIELTASKAIDTRTATDIVLDERGLSIFGAEVIRRLVSPDLALLKVVVHGPQFFKLKPVPIARDCNMNANQQVFTIGYPDISHRTSLDIPYRHIITKRWSSGYIVKHLTSKNRGRTGHVTGTTADSAEGSSGGAVVNLRGELVGIHVGSRKVSDQKEDGKMYIGDEYSDPKIHHSLFARCEYIEAFASMGPISLDPEAYYKTPKVTGSKTSTPHTNYSK